MSEKVLDKVRKLLAMANDERGNDQERENALRQAHALLTKHQLTIEQLDARQREIEDPREVFESEGWNLVWCRTIRNAISHLFMCSYYHCKINATRGRHTYVGRASNTTTAAYMSDWIIQSVLREADRRYKHRLTPEGRSFATGVANELVRRVIKMREEAQVEVTSSGSALVLADLAKTEEAANLALAEATFKIGKARATRDTPINRDAYFAGRDHAKTINLNKQLKGAKPEEQLRIK